MFPASEPQLKPEQDRSYFNILLHIIYSILIKVS